MSLTAPLSLTAVPHNTHCHHPQYVCTSLGQPQCHPTMSVCQCTESTCHSLSHTYTQPSLHFNFHHKVASNVSLCHPNVSLCHSLYHHVTLQEVHNLLQPLRVHGPPHKGVTVPLDQEEGHSPQQTWMGQRDRGTLVPGMKTCSQRETHTATTHEHNQQTHTYYTQTHSNTHHIRMHSTYVYIL